MVMMKMVAEFCLVEFTYDFIGIYKMQVRITARILYCTYFIK